MKGVEASERCSQNIVVVVVHQVFLGLFVREPMPFVLDRGDVALPAAMIGLEAGAELGIEYRGACIRLELVNNTKF